MRPGAQIWVLSTVLWLSSAAAQTTFPPPPQVPLPLPRKTQACLEHMHQVTRLGPMLTGVETTLGTFNAGSRCRVPSATRVLKLSQPTHRPDIVGFVPPGPVLSTQARRDTLHRRAAEISAQALHLEVQRRTLERVHAGREGGQRLRAKLHALVPLPGRGLAPLAAPPPTITAYHSSRAVACFPSEAEQRAAAARFDLEHPQYGFLEDWRAVVDTINLSSSQIVPSGVSTCERGALQQACSAVARVDWSDRCWSRESPGTAGKPAPDDFTCAAELPRSKLALIGTACLYDPELAYAPFVPSFSTRRTDLLPSKARNSPSVSYEEMIGELESWDVSAAGVIDRWSLQWRVDQAAVKPHLATFGAALAHESRWLSEEAKRLAIERAALDALAAEVQKLKRELASASTARDEAKKQVTAAEAMQSTARRRMDDLTSQIKQARTEVTELQTKLRELKIDCGGTSYSACTDETARQRYDRARYEGYEQLGEFRKTLADLQDARDASRQEWQAATQERIAAQKVMLKKGEKVTGLAGQVRVREEEWARRTATWTADTAFHGQIQSGHDADKAELARATQESTRN